jgi:hypothetical protein
MVLIIPMMFARFHRVSLTGAALTTLLLLSWHPASSQDTITPALPDQTIPSAKGGGPAQEKGYTVLGNGPIHEAYAQPYKKSPAPTPIVSKKPPPAVPEEPPDQKPAGEKVQWIPGYWAWDVDRKDFIWVSGIWRLPPPGRQWVPGYWMEAEGGWRWVAGYWADAGRDDSGIVPAQTDYLPSPPASLDYGPTVPAPDDNSIYEPGSWVYRDDRYRWRPGFWTTGYDDWVWNPPSYSWTPAGCVNVNGYWDYPLANRGLLCVPICFNQPLWEKPGWIYQPNCAFGVGGLLSALFCRPDCGCYYCGNYCGAAYAALGFQPWCDYGWRGFGYDPLFNHYAWANRFHPGWQRGLRSDFLARQATWTDTLGHHGLPGTVTPLHQLHGNGLRLASLDRAQRAQQFGGARRFHTLADQRVQADRAVVAGIRPARKRFATTTRSQFGDVRGNSGFGNTRAGQVGGVVRGSPLRNDPGGRAAISSPYSPSGNRSPFRNGSPVDSRSYRSPTAKREGRSGPGNGNSRQSFDSAPGNAAHLGGSNGAGYAPQGRYTGGGSSRVPSFSHPTPAFRGGGTSSRGGAPSFHGGGSQPSYNGRASSYSGGHSGGGHSGGGHSGGGHSGGGHSSGGNGGGGHHK